MQCGETDDDRGAPAMELERERRRRSCDGGRRDRVPAQAAQERYGERGAEER